ncbi:MAG: hypothetical protein AAGU06_00140 [Candidatus Shapirobacteria bacterium]
MLWLLLILAIFGYLYISWRTMRESYKEEEVVAFSWVALMLFFIGGRIGYGLSHFGEWNSVAPWLEFWKINEINLWAAVGVWMAFAVLISKDKEWKIWPFLEDNLISLGFLVFIVSITVKDWHLISSLVVSMLLTLPVRRKYRSFLWFKSGRKGFMFFWYMICFCLIFGILNKSLWAVSSLIFVGGLFMLGYDKFSK